MRRGPSLSPISLAGLCLALIAMLGPGLVAPGVMPAHAAGGAGFVLCTADGPVPMPDPLSPPPDHGGGACLFAAAHAAAGPPPLPAALPDFAQGFIAVDPAPTAGPALRPFAHARPAARAPPSGR